MNFTMSLNLCCLIVNFAVTWRLILIIRNPALGKTRWMQFAMQKEGERIRDEGRNSSEERSKKAFRRVKRGRNEGTIGNNKIWSRQDDKATMLLSPVGGSPSSAKTHRLKVNQVQRALSKQRTIATPATQPESRALYEILLSPFASRPSVNPLCSSLRFHASLFPSASLRLLPVAVHRASCAIFRHFILELLSFSILALFGNWREPERRAHMFDR